MIPSSLPLSLFGLSKLELDEDVVVLRRECQLQLMVRWMEPVGISRKNIRSRGGMKIPYGAHAIESVS